MMESTATTMTSPSAPERRIYPRPPIVEAIIEFHYSSDASQDAVLEALRNRLGETYKGELKKQNRIQLQALVDGDTVQSSTTTLPHVTFLRTADDLRQLGVGSGILSVHVLAPYPGWERFLEQAQAAVQALPQSARSGSINALAVRYIDRIVLPEGDVQSFLTVMPHRPGRMPAELRTFHVVIEATDSDGTNALLTIASATTEPEGKPALIYDLNLRREDANLCSFANDSWLAIAEELHRRQREIFEESITDKMRELFQ